MEDTQVYNMIAFGYVKDHRYTNDGCLLLKVRIPSIHGAYSKQEYKGKQIRNYTEDNDLPWYPSILLPTMPNEGEVVALTTMNENSYDFFVIGVTGGFFNSVNTDSGEW